MREWSATQEEVMPFFNLLKRVGIIVATNRVSAFLTNVSFNKLISYEVTGMSPQSMTFAQELKGFA